MSVFTRLDMLLQFALAMKIDSLKFIVNFRKDMKFV